MAAEPEAARKPGAPGPECQAARPSGAADELGLEVAALLQERHGELMRSIELWLRHEEEMVQILFQSRVPRDSKGATAPLVKLDLCPTEAEEAPCDVDNDSRNSSGFGAIECRKTTGSNAGAPPPARPPRASFWSEDEKTRAREVADSRARARRTNLADMADRITRLSTMFGRGGTLARTTPHRSVMSRRPLTDDEHHRQALIKARSRTQDGICGTNQEKQEAPPPKKRTWTDSVKDFVRAPFFTGLVFLVILTNILLVGLETDYSAGGLGELNASGDTAFKVFNVIYTVLFATELVLRILADGCGAFCCSKLWQWNWFETLIVVLSVADVLLSSLQDSDSGFNMGQNWMIRLFRVVRILRTLRLVRVVSFIREVIVVVQSITATLRSLVWAMVLMLVVLYGFGIIFTQAVTDYRTTHPHLEDIFLERHWSTLPRSILSLFEGVTGGVSWLEILQPLSDVSWVLVALFLVFFVFVYFCLLNVMTAVFCQNAIESATLDKEIASLALLDKKQQWAEEMRVVFTEMDSKQVGVVDVEEFERSLNDEKMLAFLASREIDVHDAWTLFKLLDNDQRGLIEIENFVDGLLQLKGPAKAMQIAKVLHDGRILRHQMQASLEKIEERLDRLLLKDSFAGLSFPSLSRDFGRDLPAGPASSVASPRAHAAGPAAGRRERNGQEQSHPPVELPGHVPAKQSICKRPVYFEPVEPMKPRESCSTELLPHDEDLDDLAPFRL